MSKVWFVTGSSRGFGRQFVEAALQRGDRVAATARSTDSLRDLLAAYGEAVLPLALDVTDKAAAGDAVQRAHDHFGRLDVVVNNAGYGLFGTVEELAEQQIRDQMETNFFGALWVTQAALPLLRAQGSGHIVQISSIGGVTAHPGFGGYHASKWALEGLTDSLAQEVAGFGINVTLVEPSGFATDWSGSSAAVADQLPAYDGVREAINAAFNSLTVGDPTTAGQALLKIVDADNPPLRVFFGTDALQLVPPVYAERLKTWEEWAAVSAEAQGATAGDDMTQQVSRDELVARLVRAGELELSGEDQAEAATYFDTENFRFHGPDGLESGFAGVDAYFASVREAFDDRSIRRGIVVAEGNYVACQTWIEGTFVREFTQSPVGPLPPNGKRIVFDLINIFRVDDQGRVAEEWVRTDNRGLLRQLGAEGS
ncbi:SDR family NAD(P)-dependent oxidoreductase [Streptomyces sp. NPDC005485]|uniref:SDR family NAD(P)-dependent oxidoreductase n=1 Tax=Streptomyces sp. NPDC005485 TaxID=3155591 RepID=UPI0033B54786